MASETQHDAACQCGHASAEHDAKRGGVCLTRSGYCGCARFVAGATAQDAEAAEVIAQMRRTGGQPYDAHDLRCIARALAAARADGYEAGWNAHYSDRLASEHADVRALAAAHAVRWWGQSIEDRLSDMADYAELKARIANTKSSVTVAETMRAAAIRARGNESGVADPTRGDAAGEQAQPPQHRDAAGNPADSSGARCTLCGASRINEVAGTYGACGNLDCRDPMHDYRKEHAPTAPAPVAAAAASEVPLSEIERSAVSLAKYHAEHAGYGGASWEFHARAQTFILETAREVAELRAEARRFYLADGTFIDLEPARVVERRKAAAAEAQQLRAEVARLTWERDTALAGFQTHEAAEKERQEALAAAHAEVARLREENARLRSCGSFECGDCLACMEAALASEEHEHRHSLESIRWELEAQGAWRDEMRPALRLIKAKLAASEKPAITHPAPPASEPTREALLAALKECYRLASDGHFLEHGSACEATAIQIVAARALAGLATEKDVAAWSNEHPRIAAERAALAAAKESR